VGVPRHAARRADAAHRTRGQARSSSGGLKTHHRIPRRAENIYEVARQLCTAESDEPATTDGMQITLFAGCLQRLTGTHIGTGKADETAAALRALIASEPPMAANIVQRFKSTIGGDASRATQWVHKRAARSLASRSRSP
jgi:hypothetical protein